MALRLDCPRCGARSVHEFRYGGELRRAPDPAWDAERRLVDHVWMRTNAEGPVRERWFHAFGCRRWCTVDRDTRA